MYIGSPVSATGKVSGVTGIVPGPPEGSRGPPGGATYPGGPRGLKWEGNQPLVGWAPPMGLPLRLGLETLGVGAPHLAWGGGHPPSPLAAAPLEISSLGPAPPLGAYIKEGRGEGSRTLCLGASLPLLHLVLLPQQLGEALPEFCCIHHHAVVLLDHHQPLLPPCWIKKEETSSALYVLNAEVPSVRH